MTLPLVTLEGYSLSTHAALRLRERLHMSESWVLSRVGTDRCFWVRRVGPEGQNYALIYSPLSDTYGIAVVQPGSKAVVTVLTQAQWDSQFKPLTCKELDLARQQTLVPDTIQVRGSFGFDTAPEYIMSLPLSQVPFCGYRPGCPAKNRNVLKSVSATKIFKALLRDTLRLHPRTRRLQRLWLAFVETAYHAELADPGAIEVTGKIGPLLQSLILDEPVAPARQPATPVPLTKAQLGQLSLLAGSPRLSMAAARKALPVTSNSAALYKHLDAWGELSSLLGKPAGAGSNAT